jgi:hypothetical protein
MTTGILERIEAKLDALLAGGGAAASPAALGAPQVALQPQPALVPQVAPQADPMALGGGLAGQQQALAPQYPPATAEQITALITPYVENPNLKAALQQQMAAMGIGALPDAQPHQYGELHYRFTQVIQQAQNAAAQQQQVQPPASII